MALTDQQIWDQGLKFISPQKYHLNPFVFPGQGTQEQGITNAGVPQPYKGYPSYDAWLAAQTGAADNWSSDGNAFGYGTKVKPGDPSTIVGGPYGGQSGYYNSINYKGGLLGDAPQKGPGRYFDYGQTNEEGEPLLYKDYTLQPKKEIPSWIKAGMVFVPGGIAVANKIEEKMNPGMTGMTAEEIDNIQGGSYRGAGHTDKQYYDALAGQGMLFEGPGGIKTLTGKNFGAKGYIEGQMELADQFKFTGKTDQEIQDIIDEEGKRHLDLGHTGKGFVYKQMLEARAIYNKNKSQQEWEEKQDAKKKITLTDTDKITTDDGTIDGGKVYTGDEWKGHGAYGGGEGGIHTGEKTIQTTSAPKTTTPFHPSQGGQNQGGSNQGNIGGTQHGSSGMTKDQQAAFHHADGGRVYFDLGGLASILGREGLAPGGPAGGASAGGDYGGNVNPEQEYAGKTFQETYGGGDNNPPVPKDDDIPSYLLEEPKDKNIVELDWLTTEPELNINLERAKARAQLNLIDSIRNQQLEGQIGAKIGPVDFTTMINEGDIGNTNVNLGNWSANIDPYANLQDISYANNIGGWDVGGSYRPEEKNFMIDISKTFKHGGLAGLL